MQNSRYSTKSIIEAGLISAIIVVIFLIGTSVQVIPLIGVFILPIPITILYIRHGFRTALASVFVSTIISALLINPVDALTGVILFGAIGLMFGYCIKRDFSSFKTYILMSIAILIAQTLNVILVSYLIDKTGIIGMITKFVQQANQGIDMVKNQYGKNGLNTQQLSMINGLKQVLTVDMMLKLIPAGLIANAFVSSYVNYLITRSVLKKLRYEIKELGKFTEIFIPSIFILIIIVGYCTGLFLNAKKIPAGDYILYSSYLLFQYVLMIQGFSVAAYYLKNKLKINNGVIAFIIIVTSLMNLSQIYVVIALADLIVDFRKINKKRYVKR